MKTPEALSASARRGGVALCIGVFVLSLAVHLFCASLGWNNLPLDGHEFRQTQTALTIRYLARDGLRLDYPTPLLGKPWSIPLEFPLHQGVAAILHRHSDLTDAQAGRLVSLFFFYASLPALYLLVRRLGLDPPRSLLVPACVLASPLYLYYPRTVLIESTALCLSLWFLWFFWSALVVRRWGYAIAAFTAGALAAMVKLPTFCAFLTPVVLILVSRLRSGSGPQTLVVSALVPGAAFAAGLAWSAYADGIKRLNPLAETLLSSSNRAWATGEPALRLDPALWASFAHTTEAGVLGFAGLIVLALTALLATGVTRWRVGLLFLCYVAPLLVFSNVYRIHDYYYFANGVFLLTALGLALSAGLDGSSVRRWLTAALLAVVLGTGWHDYRHGYHGLIAGNAHRRPELGRALQAVTAPDDIIVIIGQDWNPVTPYLADRRALMLPFPREEDAAARDAAYELLEAEHVGALVVTGSRRTRTELTRPVIERFGLAATPQLSSDQNDVYLPAAKVGEALPVLLGLGLREHRVDAANRRMSAGRLAVGDTALFAAMSPTPREVAAQFGLGTFPLEGGVAFSAHPDCELVFTLPAGAHRLRAGFGLLPGAYEGTEGTTDGVQFSALWQRPDGSMQVLAARLLTPQARADDRGVQLMEVAIPAGASGDLVLRTDPGPAGNRSFDWAFWTFVTIK